MTRHTPRIVLPPSPSHPFQSFVVVVVVGYYVFSVAWSGFFPCTYYTSDHVPIAIDYGVSVSQIKFWRWLTIPILIVRGGCWSGWSFGWVVGLRSRWGSPFGESPANDYIKWTLDGNYYSRRSWRCRVLFNKLNHLCSAVPDWDLYGHHRHIVASCRSVQPTCADACTIIFLRTQYWQAASHLVCSASEPAKVSLVCVDEMDWIGMDVINLEWCYCSIWWVTVRHVSKFNAAKKKKKKQQQTTTTYTESRRPNFGERVSVLLHMARHQAEVVSNGDEMVLINLVNVNIM